jgi:hypothetical protein
MAKLVLGECGRLSGVEAVIDRDLASASAMRRRRDEISLTFCSGAVVPIYIQSHGKGPQCSVLRFESDRLQGTGSLRVFSFD